MSLISSAPAKMFPGKKHKMMAYKKTKEYIEEAYSLLPQQTPREATAFIDRFHAAILNVCYLEGATALVKQSLGLSVYVKDVMYLLSIQCRLSHSNLEAFRNKGMKKVRVNFKSLVDLKDHLASYLARILVPSKLRPKDSSSNYVSSLIKRKKARASSKLKDKENKTLSDVEFSKQDSGDGCRIQGCDSVVSDTSEKNNCMHFQAYVNDSPKNMFVRDDFLSNTATYLDSPSVLRASQPCVDISNFVSTPSSRSQWEPIETVFTALNF